MKRFLIALAITVAVLAILVISFFVLIVNDEPTAPSCTETGLGEGKHLALFSIPIKKQEVIPALGHDIIHYNGKKPTCTEAGYEPYDICTRCDYSTYTETPALGHDFSDNFCTRCKIDYVSYLISDEITDTKVTISNVGYDFYKSQKGTGIYSNYNCGPACVYMAAKWYNESFSAYVEDIRNLYVKPFSDGYGWSSDTIRSALAKYEINSYYYHIASLSTSYDDKPISDMKKYLDRGDMMIISYNAKDISDDPNCNTLIGSAYKASDFGHFVVIKGYCVVDGKTYFEIYDPNLPEGYKSPISNAGKTRYYDAIELSNSAYNWCITVVVVPHNTSK